MSIAFRAAALLHDVGHPPFSHALEAEAGAAGKLRSEVRKEAVARLPTIILEAIDNYV